METISIYNIKELDEMLTKHELSNHVDYKDLCKLQTCIIYAHLMNKFNDVQFMDMIKRIDKLSSSKIIDKEYKLKLTCSNSAHTAIRTSIQQDYIKELMSKGTFFGEILSGKPHNYTPIIDPKNMTHKIELVTFGSNEVVIIFKLLRTIHTDIMQWAYDNNKLKIVPRYCLGEFVTFDLKIE